MMCNQKLPARKAAPPTDIDSRNPDVQIGEPPKAIDKKKRTGKEEQKNSTKKTTQSTLQLFTKPKPSSSIE